VRFDAVQAELPALPPVVVRGRFHFRRGLGSPRCEEPPHPRAGQPLPPLASNPDVQCDRRPCFRPDSRHPSSFGSSMIKHWQVNYGTG